MFCKTLPTGGLKDLGSVNFRSILYRYLSSSFSKALHATVTEPYHCDAAPEEKNDAVPVPTSFSWLLRRKIQNPALEKKMIRLLSAMAPV
jgi:hypothetical protein